MLRVILVVAAIGVTIYAVIDCVRSPADQVRALPKPVWLMLIVVTLMIGLGGIAYLVFGRPNPESGAGPPGGGQVYRGPAPDDDPDFLRSLGRKRPDEGENRKRT
jgi:hypothetical protein